MHALQSAFAERAFSALASTALSTAKMEMREVYFVNVLARSLLCSALSSLPSAILLESTLDRCESK